MSKRDWKTIRGFEEIKLEHWSQIGKITINRPRYYNAFTPTTTTEMSLALDILREDQGIYTIILTGEGDKAFCSGGDQNVKGRGGYIGKDGVPRLNVLDVQRKIRSMPKPVVAMVNGYAIGGGHVLHVVCDLSIASENAIFRQAPKWAALMPVWVHRTWQVLSGKRKRVRYGSSTNNTPHRKRWKWDW